MASDLYFDPMKTPVASYDVTRISLAVLFIGILVIGSYWVLKPFLPALIWATMIVIATWPLMRNLQSRFRGRRGLAVVVMTLGLLLIFVIPLWLAISTVAQNIGVINRTVQKISSFETPSAPEWLGRVPFIGSGLSTKWAELGDVESNEIISRVTPFVGSVVSWFAAQAGNLGMLVVHFFLTVVLSAILYLKGETAAQGVRSFARRLAGDSGEGAARLAAQAIRAVALGIVVTSLLQSIVAGIGLLVAGVPRAVLLTALVFMFGLVQIGPAPILIPTVIWLYWSGSSGWATFMVVWSLLVFLMDNFLRPILIKKGADLPLLLIFAGVIGGLMAFGMIGLFVGPVILAVSYTLMNAWIDQGSVTGSGRVI